MGGETVRLSRNVRPGQKVNVGVDLVSPSAEGAYSGIWTLQAGNREFGDPLRVRINVEINASGKIYDFADHFCTAQWRTSSRTLPCPGSIGNRAGFVVKVDEARLEIGQATLPGIWTHPPFTRNTWIRGTFPALIIQTGDHFVADIGCMRNFDDCDVVFQLQYQTPSDPDDVGLGEWNEIYDGVMTHIDLDLSALVGQYINFHLVVRGRGPVNDNAAFWLQPQIWRP